MANNKKNLKGTWKQALISFLSPILIILALRWLLIEPFVIPSGSMIPNLLVHDHILVNKLSYGVRFPFTDFWLLKWKQPQRGDVVVFKYPTNPDVFFIKRLIGLPGDTVEIKNKVLFVNGIEWKQFPAEYTADPDTYFRYYVEKIDSRDHLIRFYDREEEDEPDKKVFHVPEGHYFFMGDNRDQSSDGRVWGFVPSKYLVGQALIIWLSCDQMFESASFACDPSTIRWDRLMKSVR